MTKNYYLDNKRFEELIKLYQSNPEIYGEELTQNFSILIENILHSFNFKLEEDDAKQECFLLIFKILKNFKPIQGTAFNYFTTIILNNLKLIYSKNKRYDEKIFKFKNKLNNNNDQD